MNHVQIDYELAGYVTGSAVLGTVIGVTLSQRIVPKTSARALHGLWWPWPALC